MKSCVQDTTFRLLLVCFAVLMVDGNLNLAGSHLRRSPRQRHGRGVCVKATSSAREISVRKLSGSAEIQIESCCETMDSPAVDDFVLTLIAGVDATAAASERFD